MPLTLIGEEREVAPDEDGGLHVQAELPAHLQLAVHQPQSLRGQEPLLVQQQHAFPGHRHPAARGGALPRLRELHHPVAQALQADERPGYAVGGGLLAQLCPQVADFEPALSGHRDALELVELGDPPAGQHQLVDAEDLPSPGEVAEEGLRFGTGDHEGEFRPVLARVDVVKRGVYFPLEDLLALLLLRALFRFLLLFLLLVHLSRDVLLPDVSVCGESVEVLVDLGQLSAELLEDVHVVLLRDYVEVDVGQFRQHFPLDVPAADVADVLVDDFAQLGHQAFRVGVHQEVLAQEGDVGGLQAGRGVVEAEELAESAEVGHRAPHVGQQRVVELDEAGPDPREGLRLAVLREVPDQDAAGDDVGDGPVDVADGLEQAFVQGLQHAVADELHVAAVGQHPHQEHLREVPDLGDEVVAQRVDAAQHHSLELLASEQVLELMGREDQQELPHLQLQLVPAAQEHLLLQHQTHADLEGSVDEQPQEAKVGLAEADHRERSLEGEDEEEAGHCAVVVGLEWAVVLQVEVAGTALRVEVNG